MTEINFKGKNIKTFSDIKNGELFMFPGSDVVMVKFIQIEYKSPIDQSLHKVNSVRLEDGWLWNIEAGRVVIPVASVDIKI